MNLKNGNVKRRIKKYYKDLERWGTAEHKAAHITRDKNRHITHMGQRVLAGSTELMPSVQPPAKSTWRDGLRSLIKR